MNRRSIRITKVNLSNLMREHGGGDTDTLENAFTALQGSLTIANEKSRAAAEAEAKASIVRAGANIATAEAQTAFLAFLRLGSSVSSLVATEQNWLPPFRNSEGDICIENPFTLRDQRVAARAMHNNMAKAAEGSDDTDLDIFDNDERT